MECSLISISKFGKVQAYCLPSIIHGVYKEACKMTNLLTSFD